MALPTPQQTAELRQLDETIAQRKGRNSRPHGR